MVVEHKVRTLDIWQIRQDVARPDFDQAVLHILGMHELDVIDEIEVLEQHSANEAIEVTAGDKAVRI